MPSRRRRVPLAPRVAKPVNSAQTRFDLLTYTLSRLPPRQLPFLAAYAALIVYASSRGWIPKASLGKAGASIVGVLSMVTGLLLSYRFSSAVSKWDEGKKVWVEVRSNIRDGIRLLAVPTQIGSRPSPSTSSPVDLGVPDDLSFSGNSDDGEGVFSARSGDLADSPSTARRQTLPVEIPSSGSSPTAKASHTRPAETSSFRHQREDNTDIVQQRLEELSGLFVGFAFALQHQLHGTRPLPQAPLVDLLPPAYLSSLKRTESRVRFAASHAGPSGSTSMLGLSALNPSSDTGSTPEPYRPGLRRRGTGPPSKEEREAAGEGAEEWELSVLRDKAEDAMTKLADALAGSSNADDAELRKQLSLLNIPSPSSSPRVANTRLSALAANGLVDASDGPTTSNTAQANNSAKPKSNLCSPHPPNLPLTILKLMEAYVIGLADTPVERGGWSEAKRERALGIVKSLTADLGHAERLSSNPPPLPLTLHLSHLLNIYLAALPCSLLCAVSGWSLILISVLAGWCLLGLEALITEVGGVFGQSENHQPLPHFTNQILLESVDISPSFARYYRSRLVVRVGEDDDEVTELDRRTRKNEGEWMPHFA